MIIWVIAGLLGIATGLRIGWALANKQSVVSTAMIISLGSLAIVAMLNWPPLTAFINTAVRWPDAALGLTQVALIACAAGSCVMITSVVSQRSPVVIRRVAFFQYGVAAVIAVVTVVLYILRSRQREVSSEAYFMHTVGSPASSLPWLVPLFYVLLVLALVLWVGMRHSNRSRRGRALFVFTVGIALVLGGSAFIMMHEVSAIELAGVGAAATLVGCALAIVAVGALLPVIEDWCRGHWELWLIEPLLRELGRRQPYAGVGVRPRGPLMFRVAERLSQISDALFLEATTAQPGFDVDGSTASPAPPDVTYAHQAAVIASWIDADREFPGVQWLGRPETLSDREWILEIARAYRGRHKSAVRKERPKV